MTRTKRRTAGRPASPFPKRYQVRHSAAQMKAWESAAKKDGRELQSWIRHNLDGASTITDN